MPSETVTRVQDTATIVVAFEFDDQAHLVDPRHQGVTQTIAES
jgi:hypothetical protein